MPGVVLLCPGIWVPGVIRFRSRVGMPRVIAFDHRIRVPICVIGRYGIGMPGVTGAASDRALRCGSVGSGSCGSIRRENRSVRLSPFGSRPPILSALRSLPFNKFRKHIGDKVRQNLPHVLVPFVIDKGRQRRSSRPEIRIECILSMKHGSNKKCVTSQSKALIMMGNEPHTDDIRDISRPIRPEAESPAGQSARSARAVRRPARATGVVHPLQRTARDVRHRLQEFP